MNECPGCGAVIDFIIEAAESVGWITVEIACPECGWRGCADVQIAHFDEVS